MNLPAIRLLQPVIWIGTAWALIQLAGAAEARPALSIIATCILIYVLVLFQMSLKCSHCKKALTGYRPRDAMRNLRPRFVILLPAKCRHCGHDVKEAAVKIH